MRWVELALVRPGQLAADERYWRGLPGPRSASEPTRVTSTQRPSVDRSSALNPVAETPFTGNVGAFETALQRFVMRTPSLGFGGKRLDHRGADREDDFAQPEKRRPASYRASRPDSMCAHLGM